MSMGIEKNDCGEKKKCLCEALYEIKKLQDIISTSKTEYFGNLLLKLTRVDTIPFMLLTDRGPLKMIANANNHKKMSLDSCYQTSFFRLEKVDTETCCAELTLLQPLDYSGNINNNLCDLILLKKTKECVAIDLSDVCAIQIIDLDLLTREIVIEPKY